MQTPNRILFVLAPLLLGVVVATHGDSAIAQTGQAPGVTLQLPVIRFSSVSTAVSVPDGGTINLSGGGGSSFGQSSQSGFGPLRNSNRFGSRSPSGSSLSAKIIRLKEIEQQILADHAARRSPPGRVHINGSHAVQSKADFISRNVGR